jgi:hypothetical protein
MWSAQRSDLASEFKHPLTSDEVVIAGKQLQVIFETLLPSRGVDRPPKRKESRPGRKGGRGCGV